MSEDRSPIVAFGLFAATCAMRAKAGTLSLYSLDQLGAMRADLLPDDADMADAVARFDAGVVKGDVNAAADALLNAVGQLAEGHARRISDALGEAGFDWQKRRDLA